MKVDVDRVTVLRLFCYCREAERSVHHSLDAAWSDFREYYHPEKRADIGRLVGLLDAALGAEDQDISLPTREELEKAAPAPGLFRYLFGSWIAPGKASWSFPSPVIRFSAFQLKTLLTWLSDSHKPAAEQLLRLRMDLCACCGVIEARCFGLPELSRAGRMDHFRRTEWLTFVTLNDVLGAQVSDTTPARKSA